jgi:sulfate permease, SulP family
MMNEAKDIKRGIWPASWREDVSAGITTAVMIVPQGMAYALLAGLPPILGLYASTIPLFIYALFGTSRQLAVGPVALASLLVASGINEIASNSQVPLTDGEYVALAGLITFAAGAFQLLMGVVRLGGLVNLLSHPVVSGFTAAAALIIGSSQLQHLVGYKISSQGTPFEILYSLLREIHKLNLISFGIGVSSIILIASLQKRWPKLPAALIAVIIGIVASFVIGFEELGVATLGAIPGGVPMPEIPDNFTWDSLKSVGPIGFTIALIAYMESISAAKVYARKNRYNISPSQELCALGLSNIGTAFFGGYVVGGALSRTAVNASSGAKSKLAGVVTATAVILTLTTLTGPFSYLPKSILSAIILVAVVKLIDLQEIKHLWKIKRDDLGILVLTFLATLFISIEMGILIGVGASLLWLVITTTRPTIAILGRLPKTRSYRSLDHFEKLETFDRISIFRMDAQFFFGNVAYLKDSIFKHIEEKENLVALILDASSMNALDSTAADTFEEIILELRRNGIEVMVSHVKGNVLYVLEHAGILDVLGKGHVFYEVEDAVKAALQHREAVKEGIPKDQEELLKSDMLD